MDGLESNPLWLRRYLLGEGTEDDRLRLEQRYFADESEFAALLAAEDDLVDAYLGRTLPADERARFARIFLSTPEGRRRVRMAADLRHAGRERTSPRHVLRAGATDGQKHHR